MLRSGGGHLWSDVSFHGSFSYRSSSSIWRWKWLRHGCLMVSEAREGHCEASTPSTRTLGPHLRPVHLAASDRQRRNNQESCGQLLDSHRTNQPTNQPTTSQKKKKKRTDIGVLPQHQLVKFSFEWTEVSTFPVLLVWKRFVLPRQFVKLLGKGNPSIKGASSLLTMVSPGQINGMEMT